MTENTKFSTAEQQFNQRKAAKTDSSPPYSRAKSSCAAVLLTLYLCPDSFEAIGN